MPKKISEGISREKAMGFKKLITMASLSSAVGMKLRCCDGKGKLRRPKLAKWEPRLPSKANPMWSQKIGRV
jgi:hypothetical protein